MTGQAFYARCPVCGRQTAQKRDGTLWLHTTQGEPCAGSGEKP